MMAAGDASARTLEFGTAVRLPANLSNRDRAKDRAVNETYYVP